ncbi:phosphonate metabolism protein/1,5-bisphosphokinase (PRPP-forming) PhnN [Magnetovibrio blakemorei]|uniref:Ribose 1,5-bisphosphate phosphokinase PhnN n=1 Tax=Magnetovibrio blakemorei TaxID=28181 RepID=A0A1E5Q5D4_9PROT|nr:phosphonate metabolism protein/1,5-bisphosphokinase (PRPP-forming) PhnN [Magnetovibrio blakemorei]OEJ65074.1 phosphonate metabolism protein/1,5-bisphosphokinase (PRPP-forming) PhnN [Magnetovibrio blakemorei]
MSNARGTLFLVVGPSGAGKDSLIDGAKAALKTDSRYLFPQRYITRPADAGGEDHIPVSDAAFDTLEQQGKLVLSWQAHNLRYGIPALVSKLLAQGQNIIVNVSRTVVDEARRTLAPMAVLYVTVSDDVLAARLSARGRETPADIARRVARAREYELTGEDVHVIDNGGDLEDSISSFLQAIDSSHAA